MKYELDKKIVNKIITKENTTQLVESLLDIYNKFDEKDKKFRLDVEIFPNSKYSLDESEIPIFENYLDSKKIEGIYININNGYGNEEIVVRIMTDVQYTYSNPQNISEFTVTGSQELWVNGNFTLINEIINSWQQQNSFLKNHLNSILYTINFTIGYLIILLLDKFLSLINNDSTKDTVFYNFNEIVIISLFFGLFCGMIGFVVTEITGIKNILKSFINQAYPIIELNFGPEYNRLAKKRKEVIAFVLVVLITPTILGIFINLIT